MKKDDGQGAALTETVRELVSERARETMAAAVEPQFAHLREKREELKALREQLGESVAELRERERQLETLQRDLKCLQHPEGCGHER